MKAAFLALRQDPALRALAIRDVEFGSVPGYFTLHRNLPIQLAEMPGPDGDSLTGFTHLAVPIRYPETPGFVPWGRFGTIEIRKRHAIDPATRLPETSWLLPIAFSPRLGMHYRQGLWPTVDSAGKPVPNSVR